MEKAKKLTPAEQKYQRTCKLIGVWSLTELRFVTKRSLLQLKGVGAATIKYIADWLQQRGFTFGKYTLEYYLDNKMLVWSDETGIIVFKYKVRPIISALGIAKEWAVGTFCPTKANFSSSGKPRISFRGLTAGDAQALICDAGLVLAEENTEGEIYDSQDKRFLKHFGHGSADLSNAHNIEIAGREDYE